MASDKLNPPRSVTGPTRENTSTFKVEWKAANNYQDKDNGYNWTALWVFIKDNTKKGNVQKKQHSIHATSHTYKLNRKNYYPFKYDKGAKKGQDRPKLLWIKAIVRAYHDKKHVDGGGGKSNTLEFKKPEKPTCEFDFDDTTGVLTISCKSPADDIKDRYDCVYEVYRRDVKTKSTRYLKDNVYALNTDGKILKGTNKNAEFDLVTNVEQLYLKEGSKITFTVKLTARGFAGPTSNKQTFVLKPPSPVTIKNVVPTNKNILEVIQNLDSTAYTTGAMRVFYYSPNDSGDYDENGVTDYTLQRLVTAYSVDKSAKASLLENWVDVDTNLGSTSEELVKVKKKKKVFKKAKRDAVMGEPMVDVLTALGFNNNAHTYDKRVWYRIKSVRQGMVNYSVPVEAKSLRFPKPTAAEDYSGFMALRNSTTEPGTAIVGVVGWQNDSKDNEGVDNPNWQEATWTTVVEWSEHDDAIHSNQKPNEMEMDWENTEKEHQKAFDNYKERVINGMFGEKKTSETVIPWGKSATFAIYGLNPGVGYYLWTRRHMVLGEYDEYGPRTPAPQELFPFVPIDDPKSVQVYTEDAYIYDRDLTVSWMHDAVSEQQSWSIYSIPYNESYVEGVTVVSDIMANSKLLASGTTSDTSYVIPAQTLNAIQPMCTFGKNKYFTVDRKMGIVVGLSTGGKEVYSCSNDKGRYVGANFLNVGHIPTGAIGIMDTKVTEDAISITLPNSNRNLSVSYVVSSDRKGNNYIKFTRAFSENMPEYSSVSFYINGLTNSDDLLFNIANLTLQSGSRGLVASISETTINRSYRINESSFKLELHLSENNKVVKNVTFDKNKILNSSSHMVYLFSRTLDVTGVVNVFASADTWYMLPDGEHLQPMGECVFTETIPVTEFDKVENVLSNEEKAFFSKFTNGEKAYAYVAKINVYSHRNMLDGSTYTVQGYLMDSGDENLVSEPNVITFTHYASREAEPCGDGSYIQGTVKQLTHSLQSSTVSSGTGGLKSASPPSPSVEIFVDRPPNYIDTDRFDIYRITPDGGVRISTDHPFDSVVITDMYAPFSTNETLSYAIVTVTEEGDMSWRELKYSLKPISGMRFDWGLLDNMRALELPFNVEIKDSYSKDVRIDSYLDGSVAAHFNKAIVKKSNAKTKIVRLDESGVYNDPEKFAMIRELGRYPGPVFFRSDNGTAYECVVEVDGIEDNYDSTVSQISFKMTEINPPSDRFSSELMTKATKMFEAPSIGMLPFDSKAKPQSASSKEVKSIYTINDSLYYEHTGVKKNGTSYTAVDVFSTDGFNDLNYSVLVTKTTDKYVFSIPAIEINLKKAVDQNLALGYENIVVTKGSKKTTKKKAVGYPVYLQMTMKEGNTKIGDLLYRYDQTDGKVYKLMLNSSESITVNRRSSKFEVTLIPSAYFIKAVSETKKLTIKSGKTKYVLEYTITKAYDNDPFTTYLEFNTISGTPATNSKSYYRIYVRSKPITDSGFDNATDYYKASKRNALAKKNGKNKAIKVNVGSKIKVVQKKSISTKAYISVEISYDGSSAKHTASTPIMVEDLDSVSEIHTKLSAPASKTFSIHKK